jgi:membrane protein YqaA with SNARE-associated domain
MDLAARPHALWALAFISFIESSVFPIPPDILLIPMVLALRKDAWKIAAVCTVASVLGGIAGYGVGYFLFDAVGQPVLALYGYEEKFAQFRDYYNEWGAWAVFIAGTTPFPYKVITILSGATGLNLLTFTISSILSRGIRFFLVAGLLWRFGAPIRDFIERWLGPLLIVFSILLIGSFIALRAFS